MTNDFNSINSGRSPKSRPDTTRTVDQLFDSLNDREKIAFIELMLLLFICGRKIKYVEEGQLAELLQIHEKVLSKTIKKATACGVLQLVEKAVVAGSGGETSQDLGMGGVQSDIHSGGTGANSKPWARYRSLCLVYPESGSSIPNPNQNDYARLNDIGHITELLASRVFEYYDRLGPDSDINWISLETSPIRTGPPKNLPRTILNYDGTKGDLNVELLNQIDGGLALWSADIGGLMISVCTGRALHLARHCKLYLEMSRALNISPGRWPLSVR